MITVFLTAMLEDNFVFDFDLMFIYKICVLNSKELK